ncbi:hypothetical protein ACROYT_G042265, partial [Oculina patagonica]
KHTFLQKCRTLAICQCACQVTILVTDAVESRKGFDIQPKESCNVFSVLSSSTLLFQACIITAFMIVYSDHRKAYQNQEVTSKLKTYAALSLGFIGSAMIWWYSCFSGEFLAKVAFIVVTFVMAVAFVILLFSAYTRKNIHDHVEHATSKASIKTCSSAKNVCKEERRPVYFIIMLLTCLIVILSGLSLSSLRFNEVVSSLLTSFQRLVVGIVLPLTATDLIDSSYEQEKEKKREQVLVN